ncbi:MAG: TRAM domain-containing protein [Candidatus Hydrothermales bacterium]
MFFYLNYAVIAILIFFVALLIYFVFRKKEKVPFYVLDFDTLKDHRFLELFSTDLFYFKVIISKSDYEKFKEFIKTLDEETKEKFILYLKDLEKKKKNRFLKIVNFDIENFVLRKRKAKVILSNRELKRSFEEKGLEFIYFPDIVKLFKPTLKKGEVIKLKISRRGRYFDEGIGFLEDDTPCIVKGGSEFLGREVEVLIEKIRETFAGIILEGRIFKGDV